MVLEPNYQQSGVSLYHGDALEVLPKLPAGSVHCAITSPPYWGLRDYGVEGQLGLEPTPEEYVERMVAVFREVWRVLRDDGTLWLNLGDSYYHGGNGQRDPVRWPKQSRNEGCRELPKHAKRVGRPKDMVGIPWRVALALQADGWYLRSDVIWHKPTPMPEAVKDRPTKAHEYIFLLTKSARYHYDAKAIAEPVTGNAHCRGSGVNPKAKIPAGWDTGEGDHREKRGRYPRPKQNESFSGAVSGLVEKRNKRTVWTVQSVPYPGAHFATFPPKLIEPCIKAGTSERGCCSECGAPWERVVEKEKVADRPGRVQGRDGDSPGEAHGRDGREGSRYSTATSTKGFRPTCDHNAKPIPCTVLDPFSGSATTALVAQRLGRHAIGIELSEEYLGLSRRRLLPGQAALEDEAQDTGQGQLF